MAYRPRSLGDSLVGPALLILGGPLGALPKGSVQKITGLFLGKGGGVSAYPIKRVSVLQESEVGVTK